MKTSAAGRKAITEREGVRLKAYQDSVGIWTIGVGHTAAAGPPTVARGLTITAALADQILTRDLSIFEKSVNDSVKVPLSQGEFDALVSLAFNIGSAAFKKSTLVKELNKGNRYGAANEFLKWDKVTINGKKKALKGLTIRRKAEREQFLSKAEAVIPAPTPKPVTIERAPVPGGNWLANLLSAILALFRGNR